VPAAVPVLHTGWAGSTAAALSELFLGRAFIPVAAAAGLVPVLFPACAGVHGESVIVVICSLICWLQ